MRGLPLALPSLYLAFLAMSLAAASPTLVLKPYGQRLADRYTAKDGLPPGRILGIEAGGKAGIRAWGERAGAIFQDGRWKPEAKAAGDDFSFVDTSKLSKGARVLDAARGADRRVWVVTDGGVFRSDRGRYVAFGPPA